MITIGIWTPIKALYTYGGVKYFEMKCNLCGAISEVAYSNYKKGTSKRCAKCPKPLKGVI